MIDSKAISDDELLEYGDFNNLSQKSQNLLLHQKDHWDLLNKNFNALKNVKIKKFKFDKFYINAQYNSSRIISSSAKVDEKSISQRACFLCAENLPTVQKGINYKNKYLILCNPYPIFNQHLTISHHNHTPQNIVDAFPDMLNLSHDLRQNFLVFYNGPKCGASAPDHLHFQAGIRNSTPLEKCYKKLQLESLEIYRSSNLKLNFVDAGILSFVLMQSNIIDEMEIMFGKMIKVLKSIEQTADEPLLNIISIYEDNQWNVFIFPRIKHRPHQFFLEGQDKILISPASGDMAGLLITPRLVDFQLLNNELIYDIYSQVLYDSKIIENIIEAFH